MGWERVADLAEVAVGSALRVELGGEPVCVVRVTEDEVHAVHDTCSHQEYSLAEGWVEDRRIECALHGSTFDLITGTPESLPAVTPIPVYATKVDDDGIWVDVEEQLNDAPVPRH
jgi:3-phenylpropionate/trans-cinnamate dioxygenase ferredoxin component